MGVNDPNQAALLINIWTVEVQRLVSHEHFKLLKKFSSQILQKCTKPGMLSKLDLLSPNVTVQEFYEVDNLTINTIYDYMKEKSVKILISVSERKEFLKWRQGIVADEFYEELGINNEIKLENERENRQIFKEQISKVENLNEKSGGNIELDEISDNKMEDVEGESNTEEISSHLVNEINLETTNETKQPPNENTISEATKSNEITISSVPDEVKDEKETTKNLEEAINDIKKMIELWNDQAFFLIKRFTCRLTNKDAFTLISGSYLLNINSVESDVDFIVVLPFNYNDNNGKFVTKIMLDDEFMGSKSECNFEKREECTEKGSLYCVLCENKATSWLRKITTGVSEINAKIHDYSFDLAFVAYPWERNSEQILNFIKSEESYRANIRINEITAKNKTKFRLLLLSLKLWAKSHFVYDGKLGFFSGTSLAILVTKILVDFNSSKMTIYQLLAKFFDVFTYKMMDKIDEDSNNTLVNKQKIEEHLETELEPIFIVEETNENIEKLREAIDWNETKERESRNNLYINNSENYDQFLAIVCTYNPTSEYGDEFCDFSTTRIRLQLLFSIETEIDAICHANLQKPIRDKKQCPKEFRKKGWVCIIWLVGIDFEINENNGDKVN
uniref:polynucleotide adenylyltransferase n=1 Tax=Meloidogyne javanica TaxID=6303 RepID=A0A915M9Q8_MELJA